MILPAHSRKRIAAKLCNAIGTARFFKLSVALKRIGNRKGVNGAVAFKEGFYRFEDIAVGWCIKIFFRQAHNALRASVLVVHHGRKYRHFRLRILRHGNFFKSGQARGINVPYKILFDVIFRHTYPITTNL